MWTLLTQQQKIVLSLQICRLFFLNSIAVNSLFKFLVQLIKNLHIVVVVIPMWIEKVGVSGGGGGKGGGGAVDKYNFYSSVFGLKKH